MIWRLVIIALTVSGIVTLCYIKGRNYIVLLLALEIIFLAIFLSFITFYYDNKLFMAVDEALFAAVSVIIVAAAESAVGIALVAQLYKKTKSIIVKKKS